MVAGLPLLVLAYQSEAGLVSFMVITIIITHFREKTPPSHTHTHTPYGQRRKSSSLSTRTLTFSNISSQCSPYSGYLFFSCLICFVFDQIWSWRYYHSSCFLYHSLARWDTFFQWPSLCRENTQRTPLGWCITFLRDCRKMTLLNY